MCECSVFVTLLYAPNVNVVSRCNAVYETTIVVIEYIVHEIHDCMVISRTGTCVLFCTCVIIIELTTTSKQEMQTIFTDARNYIAL